MKIVAVGCFFLFCMLIAADAQTSKCASGQGTSFSATCQSDTCLMRLRLTTQPDCTLDSCVNFDKDSIDCCGFAVTVWIPNGNCGIAELKDKKVRSQLLILARTTNILIPTCTGSYLPARIVLANEKQNHASGL
jgi:hypothetical protein